ncbi:hypothetical protein IJI99_03650 [bacterium]|nr:hypothetical protein [bacterium]
MPAIWKNLVINFEQAEEFRDLKREVLDGGIYWFDTDQEEPVIIDVGAHIVWRRFILNGFIRERKFGHWSLIRNFLPCWSKM